MFDGVNPTKGRLRLLFTWALRARPDMRQCGNENDTPRLVVAALAALMVVGPVPARAGENAVVAKADDRVPEGTEAAQAPVLDSDGTWRSITHLPCPKGYEGKWWITATSGRWSHGKFMMFDGKTLSFERLGERLVGERRDADWGPYFELSEPFVDPGRPDIKIRKVVFTGPYQRNVTEPVFKCAIHMWSCNNVQDIDNQVIAQKNKGGLYCESGLPMIPWDHAEKLFGDLYNK
jgi:hypothetical protein